MQFLIHHNTVLDILFGTASASELTRFLTMLAGRGGNIIVPEFAMNAILSNVTKYRDLENIDASHLVSSISKIANETDFPSIDRRQEVLEALVLIRQEDPSGDIWNQMYLAAGKTLKYDIVLHENISLSSVVQPLKIRRISSSYSALRFFL